MYGLRTVTGVVSRKFDRSGELALEKPRVIDTAVGVLFEPVDRQSSTQGATMADKSPRQHLSKKAGKSLKEKRAEKHAKTEGKNKPEIVPPTKKH